MSLLTSAPTKVIFLRGLQGRLGCRLQVIQHVNFTALQSAGEAAGLETEAFVTQAKFLTGIAGKIWQAPAGFGGWTAAQTRQFQTLTHPEHLGRAFRALVQTSRTPKLAGNSSGDAPSP